MNGGVFIAVEGIDGAGKTTHAKRLVKWLRAAGYRSRYTSEPTRGILGKILRAMMLKNRVDVRVEALLYAADRLEHLERVIRPLLREGVIVVSDRYVYSSLAYQSVTVGDQNWVEEINRFADKPDLTILLDIDPRDGLRRIKRGKSRFEDLEFLRRVRRKYLELAEKYRFEVVDASRGLEEVSEDVRRIVQNLLDKRRMR